jgi:hypothetical protein
MQCIHHTSGGASRAKSQVPNLAHFSHGKGLAPPEPTTEGEAEGEGEGEKEKEEEKEEKMKAKRSATCLSLGGVWQIAITANPT